MNAYARYDINSGAGLKSFIEVSGLAIYHASDLTTFNWKSRDGVVSVNCKENAMRVIEKLSNLTHIDNGVGDSVRRYSFVISSFSDLIDAIYALKTIDGNCIRS